MTMHIGIVSTGVYLPRNSISAEQIAEATNIPVDVIVNKFGVKQKPVALEDDTTAEMGIKAALKALEKGNIDASEVDLVIWFGAQHKDYPCWLAGLYIADRIGAKNAWSFDMEAMCGSFMTAIEIGRSLMLTRKDCNTVLLVSGYRNNDLVDLKENSTHFMLDLGSGGTAAILKKNAGKNVILGSAFKGDGSFSTQCIFPVFGCKSWPVKAEDLDKSHFIVVDEPYFKEQLNAKTLPNFFKVIDNALSSSGNLTRKDINYLAILHFKKSAHMAVLQELGLSESQTVYLDSYGHIGQNDQIISLELGLLEGKVKDNYNIVMVGAGLGFVWAACVVRWGPFEEPIVS
ncbi:MAG: 3-oxoacyl-ACP synthase [Spirochaetes bacterium]|nr:3-oxoacyl-ACP synthase [Spirochaetota bacterium]